MKRLVSVILLVVMILTVCATAFAADFSTPELAKNAVKNSGNIKKTTGNGTSAKVSATMSKSKATFHFRVWKYTGWQASEGARITNSGSATLKTLRDGNDEPRLWKDVNYYLAATHSSQSKVNKASSSGSWNP